MKLKSLKLENFRQHEDSYLEFNDGITVINGTNGSGKSTVLEAITWAIYGTEAARGNKDSIKFNRAKPRTKVLVELVFELDKDVFKVVRSLDKAEIYLNDNAAPVATSQQEVTKYLTDKLNMTKNEFFNTYFTGQKELNFLKNQGAMERRKFISKVLGYDRIREAQEASRADRNGLEKEISGLNQGLGDIETLKEEKKEVKAKLKEIQTTRDVKQKEFTQVSEKMAKIEPQWEEIRKFKESYDKLTMENKYLTDKLEDIEKNITDLEGQIKDLEAKSKELEGFSCIEDEYKSLETQIAKQQELQEKDTLRQQFSLQIKNLEEQISYKQKELDEIVKSGKEKRAKIEKLPEINTEINEINSKIQQINSDLSAIKREKQVLISQKQQEIKKVERQLIVILEKGENGSCPTCERPLKLEFDKVTGNFRTQIENLNTEIKNIEEEKISSSDEEIKKLKEQKALKDSEYKEFASIEGSYNTERERYKLVKAEIEANSKEFEKAKEELARIPEGFNLEVLKNLREQITPLRERYDKFLALKAELSGFDRVKSQYEAVLKTKIETQEKQKAISEELSGLNYSEEKYLETEKAHKELRDVFHNFREELVRVTSEENSIAKELDRIKKIEEENREKAELIKQKQEELDLLHELDRFYGQLWEKLNNSARPEISELAGKFLSDLTDNRYSMLELNEKYEICLHDDGEIKPVISGGEEDIVNLCIRLAVSQIIALRSGKALSLLILDEIFGSLDESRRQNTIGLLRSLTENFEQVILITHIDDMKDDIDNIINVEFDPESGSSKVTVQKLESQAELIGSLL